MHNVVNPFESPAILSTCTGMLGLDRGLEGVLGGRAVAYVEIEAFVAENLVRQMEQGVLAPAPVWTNVKTFPWEAFYGKLHWITGGYPCQPFSHAGLRAGSADPRHLWPSLSRGIEKSRPMGVWFENVEGHLTLGLRDVLTDLRKLGYQAEVGLFSAAEVGAPHRRNRVFILGLENSFLLRMRGWNDEQRAYWKRKIQTSGSGQLADACGIQGRVSDSDRWLEQEQAPWAGSGVDNSAMPRHQAGDESQPGSAVQFVGDRCGRWPARPGQAQYDWEEPRIESGLGYAINGYNYREDLLRMAGNAVVRQQAETAFRTLLMKFL